MTDTYSAMSDDELVKAYKAAQPAPADDLENMSDEDLIKAYKQLAPAEPKPALTPVQEKTVRSHPFSGRFSNALDRREPKLNDEGVDTATGGPFELRVQLARMNNPEEAQLMLRRYFKEGEFGQDKRGRWWVNQPGKDPSKTRRVLIEPEGSFSSFLSGLGAGAVAEATPMAASAMGAGAGALTGPFAPAGIPIGAGLGWMVGKGIDEFSKYMQGTFHKTPGEEIKELAKGGLINTAIPAIGTTYPMLAPWLKKKWFDVSPASSEMAKEVLAEGGIPPIGSVAPGAQGFETKRAVSARVSGDQTADVNNAWIERQVIEHLQPLGIDEATAKGMAYELARSAQDISSREAASSIVTAAQREHQRLQSTIDVNINAANRRLAKVENSMRTWANPDPNTARQVGRQLIDDRIAVSEHFDQAYKAVHQQVGGMPIIPADPVRIAATQLEQVVPPASLPPFVAKAAQLEPGSMITLEQAQEWRTFLRMHERAMKQGGNLTPGVQYHYYDVLEEAIDGAITGVAKSGRGLAPDAAKALYQVDHAYGQSIQDFKNLTVRQVVKDMEDGLVVNPGVVADKILDPKNIQAARMIWTRLTPETQMNVRAADVQNLITKSSVQDPVTGKFVLDGTLLVKNLEARRPIMEVAHPAQFMAQLRQFANAYRIANGRLDPAAFLSQGGAGSGHPANPSLLAASFKRWKLAQDEMERFVAGNPLAAFRNGTPAERDAAAAFLLSPGKQSRMEWVMASLTPQEQTEIHKYVVQKLFDEALELNSARQLVISGKKVRDFLSRYSPEQQNVILPYGMADSLKRLGDKINFVFPSLSGEIGNSHALAANAVLTKSFINPLALSKRMSWYTSAWLTNRPAVLRWFADIAEKDPAAAEPAMSALGRYLYNDAMTGPGRKRPVSEQKVQ